MIVSTAYPSDGNDLLKAVQHDLYARHVVQLFDTARTALVWADEMLDTHLLVAEKARAVERFDHRVLQEVHDIMAAAFRHAHDDGGQLQLLETDVDRVARSRAAWLRWFEDELKALARTPRFVRSIVLAVVLANTELGYAAEREACTLLAARYGLQHWGIADGDGTIDRGHG